jgi:hypothetical protein
VNFFPNIFALWLVESTNVEPADIEGLTIGDTPVHSLKRQLGETYQPRELLLDYCDKDGSFLWQWRGALIKGNKAEYS